MNAQAKAILRPMYIWAFTEALVFWYAIEKILWSSSGITPSQIVLLGIIAQSGQVLIEVPSSIIADRWSRRKTLMVSSACMLIAIAIVLSAQTFLAFAIMSLVWAIYYSFQSGTVNAYVYDLLKEQGQQAQYRKAIARFGTFELSGLLLSSLLASVLVEWGNLFTPYWLTLLPSALAIVLLWRMHEPAAERTEESTGTIVHHVRSAVRGVARKRWLSIIFLALGFMVAGRFIWYEYYQLYALERHMAVVLFGLLLALIHVGNLLGSELAHRLKSPHRVLLISFTGLLLSTAGLAFASGPVAIIAFLIVCFFGSQACSIVFDESLQHQTSSELRATTLSLAGLASRLIFSAAAVVLVLFDPTPRMIALMAFIAFTGALVFLPIRKHLVSAEASP